MIEKLYSPFHTIYQIEALNAHAHEFIMSEHISSVFIPKQNTMHISCKTKWSEILHCMNQSYSLFVNYVKVQIDALYRASRCT